MENEACMEKLQVTPGLVNSQLDVTGQRKRQPFIFVRIDDEDGEAVILVTEDDDKLFSAHTAAEAAAELLVRGIRDFNCSSSMSFSEEFGWPSRSAGGEISRHFESLEGLARQRLWIDGTEGCGSFELVEDLLIKGASQRQLAACISDILEIMEIADEVCGV